MHLKIKNKFNFVIPNFGILFFSANIFFYISSGITTLSVLDILFFLADIFAIFACFHLMLFPKKTIIYAVLSTVFTILLTFSKRPELEIYFCFVLCIVSFWNQGFYSSNLKIKKITTIIGGFVILLIRIILLRTDFLYRNWQLCPIYIIALCLYLFVKNSIRFNQMKKAELKIELSDYPEITDRQKMIIPLLLQGEKYDYISRVMSISTSSVKRDASEIYKTFFSSDRITFVSKYSNYSFFDKGIPIFIQKNTK
ncbi:MAG: hypothetical protein MJ188_06740 [Treponema sp.]|nr:hypothetical protein [Treponema sp.]